MGVLDPKSNIPKHFGCLGAKQQELKGKVGFGTAKGQNQWRYAHLFCVLGKTVCFTKQIQIH